MIKNKLFIFFLFLVCSIQAQETTWIIDIKKSYITYSGEHVLHEWEGSNQKLYGRALLDKTSLVFNELAILAYVRDFDSKNSGRDAHSLEVLEALRFPEIKFYAESFELIKDSLSINGVFEFHGKKFNKQIMSSIIFDKNEIHLKGTFDLIPSDFGISLPAFMLVKMMDLLEIRYSIFLTKESG